MRRLLKGLVWLVAIAAVVVGLAWATSPDPHGNAASFEDEPLVAGVAPLSEAITLAQARGEDGGVRTFLVLGLAGDEASVIDLAKIGAAGGSDPFAVLASVSREQIEEAALDAELAERILMSDLLPAAPTGERHIAAGTNFPEHAEEAQSDAVFQFPKFGAASPARTTVAAQPDILLDYEVELCMRFDRDVASLEDFDAATKGVFLCGDFTDRATLIRLIDPDNFDSGSGFSDAKSRPDFYPSGAMLVIPTDWQSFVADERFTTAVNGDPRQDARGKEMTLDFRGLTEKALGDMDKPRFLYQGERYKLTPEPMITRDMTLMSGTAEGVIFTPPSRGDIIEGSLAHIFGGGLFGEVGIIDTVIETFIGNEIESSHFLQPGDSVAFGSARLGDIRVEVVGENP